MRISPGSSSERSAASRSAHRCRRGRKRRPIRRLLLALAALLTGWPLGAAAEERPCAACHGESGISRDSSTPILAGLPAPYLRKSLEQYIAASRPTAVSEHRAPRAEAEIQALANRYAAQRWISARQSFDAGLAELGERLQRKCGRCHEEGGRSQEEDVPRLAGQWIPYLQRRIDQMRNPANAIPMPRKMGEFIRLRTPEEMRAILHFYASQG